MAGRTDLECVQEASTGYFTYEGAWGPCSDDFEVVGDQSNAYYVCYGQISVIATNKNVVQSLKI